MQELNDIQTNEFCDTEELPGQDSGFHLIVWNDEVNTFDWVIKALIEICKHSKEQAEQCTLFIHYKGRYTVKTGNYEHLKPMCEGITDRGINASIEEIVS